MEFIVKTFDELTTTELYEILKVRSAVFVVEQKCPYQDIDELDYRSVHMYFRDGNDIAAYLRAFYKEPDVVQIGRVLTIKRGAGLGGKLLHQSLLEIADHMPCRKIYLEAQSYATGFYGREGFQITSDEFLEDGIPHRQMELILPSKQSH
ncbi:GNAT family N-acetyltransferase [Galactobacillus timonensis]|uniref:GNAT family N-acetyltransferase n=1 Tax=Galactobacillus timonensis TaxID=2041840 RepID=UPI002409A728|nr:GNAT family N-acetyltransferase [Galactobacillus timonensis]MDD6681003.1 GNAT family N-acetyltransferase [Galactobacillus timonensis]